MKRPYAQVLLEYDELNELIEACRVAADAYAKDPAYKDAKWMFGLYGMKAKFLRRIAEDLETYIEKED